MDKKKVLGGVLALTMAVSGAKYSYAATDYVSALQSLNLLDKENTQEVLDASLQRDEGLTMVLKSLGYSQKEAEDQNYVKENPFKDVADWFKGYAGLGVSTNLAKGISDDEFAPDKELSKQEFITFILRALDYPQDKAYTDAEKIAKEVKIMDADDAISSAITKRDAAKYIYRALSTDLNNGTGWTLSDYLLSNKEIDAQEAQKQGVVFGDENKEDIKIVYFNDFHGGISEETTGKKRNIGMEKMAGYVNAVREKNANTVVLSGGDNYQGTSDSNLTLGAPVSAMMKAMKVEASAVGNHEFDWGADKMPKWAKDGNFDFLAANIIDNNTKKPVDWAKPYEIIEQGGIRIGIIGLAHPDTVTLAKRENTKDFTFANPTETANTWAAYLKDGKAEGGKVDIVVLLTHLDTQQDSKTKEITGPGADLAKGVKNVDLILTAHSHQTVNGEVNGIKVIQANYTGRALGVVDLDVKDGKVASVNTNVYMSNDIKDKVAKDASMTKVYNEIQAELKPIKGEVLGTATAEFTHDRNSKGSVTLLGQWTAQAMKEATNAQVAITNGGGLRRTLNAGTITMGDLYEIMPFDNYLVVMDLTGAQLKSQIDHGIIMPSTSDGAFVGVKVEYNPDLEFGKRITKITLEDGTPVEDAKTYRVVVNDFMFTGGDGYNFEGATNVDETYVPIRDIMVEKIKESKNITPGVIDYIKAVK